MHENTDTRSKQLHLSEDMLRGADQIAEYLFGSADDRRKVYHLAETSRLPIFRLGSVLCARRSVLMEWITAQERRVSGHRAIAGPAVGLGVTSRGPDCASAGLRSGGRS